MCNNIQKLINGTTENDKEIAELKERIAEVQQEFDDEVERIKPIVDRYAGEPVEPVEPPKRRGWW